MTTTLPTLTTTVSPVSPVSPVPLAHRQDTDGIAEELAAPRTYSVREAQLALGGIDRKTLHVWCRKAGVTIHTEAELHPAAYDAKRKALTHADVLRLARLHHRVLTPFEEAGAAALRGGERERDRSRMAARIRALEQELAALQASLARLTANEPRRSVPSTTMAPHAVSVLPVLPDPLPVVSEAPTVSARPATSSRKGRRAAGMPAAWANGRRGHVLYTAFWHYDAPQAREGRLLFATWGKLCGVPKVVVSSHAKRAAAGEIPAGLGLAFHRVQAKGGGKGGQLLRYVDATQRAAWLAYWRQLDADAPERAPYVTHVPQEAEVQEALDELSTWDHAAG